VEEEVAVAAGHAGHDVGALVGGHRERILAHTLGG
jgi:hypothetical protein